MAHFAHINNENIVDQVIIAEQDFIDTLQDSSNWIQTSYNTRGGIHYDPITNNPDDKLALRKNYAGVGYYYDINLDAFIPPKPSDEYILDEETCLWIQIIE
jgi:hypothetical protein